MHLFKNFLYLFFLNCCFSFSQTISVSEILSENKITTFENQKIILLDFWATWCAPCIIASKQLEYVQKANANKLFIISISDENSSKLNQFLQKKPINLMVVSDFENNTFEKFNVTTRPYSVLFGLDGKVLWQGHPSDLSQIKIDNFYNSEVIRNVNRTLNGIIKVKTPDVEVSEIESDIFSITESNNPSVFSISDKNVKFSGLLSDLLLKVKNCYPYEIVFSDKTNVSVLMSCPKLLWFDSKDEVFNLILNQLNLSCNLKQKQIAGSQFIIKNSALLWDKNQIIWDENSISESNSIIGTDRIQADNIDIQSFCKLISKAKNKNFFYEGLNVELYDWDLNYLYDNLMLEELESTFGIIIEPTVVSKNVMLFSKK